MTRYAEQMAIIRSHQKQWPVQTVPIANALGLRVYNVRNWSDDISGMIKKDADDGGSSGYGIYVNGDHREARRRFTIAHEIAHFVLHESLIGDGIVEDALMRAEGFSSTIETEANRFAADILMPWNLLDDARDSGILSVPDLAREFAVSKSAMSYRLYKTAYKGDA